MKLPLLIVLAGLAGLTVSVRAFQGTDAAVEPKSQTTYYANGQVETDCEVHGGQRDGACRRYFANGGKQAEGTYVAGKMDGEWTFWREDGTVDPARSGRYAGGNRVAP